MSIAIKYLKRFKLVFVAIAVFLISMAIDINFVNRFNIKALLTDIAIVGTLALGQALVIYTRAIDLSVGSIASMSTVLIAWMMLNIGDAVVGWLNILICILFTLVFGGALGFITGISVAKFKLPPIIASLGTMWIGRGFAFFFLRGMATPYPEKAIIKIASTSAGPFPVSFFIYLILAAAVYIVLTRTQAGRSVYAVGGNEYAAHISGIKVNKVKTMVYVVSGLLAALGGVVLGAYTGTSYPKAANGYELLAIAGAVMGGTSLAGGEGNIFNCVMGVTILRIINKTMIFANLSGYLEGAYIGVILIVVLLFSNRNTSGKKRWLSVKRKAATTSKAGE